MRSLLMVLVVLAVSTSAACDRSPPLAGRYEAVHDAGGGPGRPLVLELGEAGQGAWNTDSESIAFKWDVKGKELWLHTRAGGVIQAAVVGRELVVDMPGAGRLVFRRAEKQ
ncbi:MAG: hypothetical protein GYA47_09815 [Desulfovibrio sp.]|nr:hypothetical protein [Desulfovibrio sp.]